MKLQNPLARAYQTRLFLHTDKVAMFSTPRLVRIVLETKIHFWEGGMSEAKFVVVLSVFISDQKMFNNINITSVRCPLLVKTLSPHLGNLTW